MRAPHRNFKHFERSDCTDFNAIGGPNGREIRRAVKTGASGFQVFIYQIFRAIEVTPPV
jgi:hypothetical protein